MKDILAALPPPTAQYAAPGVEFDVYRAKNLNQHGWNSPALKRILLLCRNSYARYGDRPLLDAYDKKAAIYLVRARYGAVQEWLSIRMVPGDGKPLGVHEPEIFEWEGRPADALMRKKIGARNARSFWRQVAGSQRMCGIHPYAVRNFKFVFLKDPGHRYTAVCFALMHMQFVRDYPLRRFPYRYITALIRPDYYKKGLAYTVRRSSRSVRLVYPLFTPARSFLGLRRGEVRVKRDVFSYQFPLYWFDVKKLLRLVNGLRRKHRKSGLRNLEPSMFSNIGKAPDRPAQIAGIKIEPEKMRRLMDRLPDAPGLKITPAAKWYRGMGAVLKAAGVKALEKPPRNSTTKYTLAF